MMAGGIGPVLMATPEVKEDGAPTGENSWTGVNKTPCAQWGPKKRRLHGRHRRRAEEHEDRNRWRGRNGRHRIGRRSWWPTADGGRRSQRRRQILPEFWSPATRSWMLAMR